MKVIMQDNDFLTTDINQKHLIIKRGLVTFLITIAYIAMATIPLPFINQAVFHNIIHDNHLQILQTINLLDGSNIQQGSILMIGIMPFITVQLIMQILQTGLSKKVKALSETSTGQVKLGILTKLITVPITFVQSWFTLSTIDRISKSSIFINHVNNHVLMYFYLSLVLTTCTLIVIWFSDLNTLYGLGNGLNYIITCSIIISLIQNSALNKNIFKQWYHALGTKLIVIIVIGLILLWLYNALYIWYQSSYLALPLHFSQLNSSVTKTGVLPFSLNIANVMPVCFASITINALYMLSLWQKSLHGLVNFVNFKTWGSIFVYAILLVAFTYVFTLITFYPPTLSENLDRQSIYITGVAPTLQTIDFLFKAIMKLATGNILFLMLVVIVPMIICKLSGLAPNVMLSSATVFIIITTEIDIRRQISGLSAKTHVPTLFDNEIVKLQEK